MFKLLLFRPKIALIKYCKLHFCSWFTGISYIFIFYANLTVHFWDFGWLTDELCLGGFGFMRSSTLAGTDDVVRCIAKKQYRNFETNIPTKGIARPQSIFPHSVCERFIYSRDRPWSICLFCWRKYVDRSWEYINRSQTHECGNRDWGHAIPRKGIHKWDFRCSVLPQQCHFCLPSWVSYLVVIDGLTHRCHLTTANFTLTKNFQVKSHSVVLVGVQYNASQLEYLNFCFK